MKTRRFLLVAGVLLVMASMASCTNDDSPVFVGKWIKDDNSESFELFKDGTGVTQKRYKDRSISISWKLVENRRFVVTTTIMGSLVSEVFSYEISGSKLTLIDDKGKKEIYVKLQEGKIEGETLKDKRDGKKYKTVIIGEQTWMAENLNYDAEGSKCYGEGGEVITEFDDNDNPTATKTLSDKEVLNNCAKYGRLYDWTTAKEEACPSGWHLPSKSEWEKLTDFIGGEKIAGKKLKSNSGWNENGNGTDDFGFSALPGGEGYSGGSFYHVGYGNWWSASEYSSNLAYYPNMRYDSDFAYWNYNDRSYLLSVRCLQD
jgi:uncharacterized protein (TIGR02145 family)